MPRSPHSLRRSLLLLPIYVLKSPQKLQGSTAQPRTQPQTNFAHPGIEAVIIALPDHLHLAAAEAAAAAGKAMLVEKPLAVDAEEAKAIVRVPQKRRRRS